MHTQTHSIHPVLRWLLILSALSPLLAAGCAKPAQSPMATETPAQLQQSIQNHAQSYGAFMQSHPNAYNTQGSQPVNLPGGH